MAERFLEDNPGDPRAEVLLDDIEALAEDDETDDGATASEGHTATQDGLGEEAPVGVKLIAALDALTAAGLAVFGLVLMFAGSFLVVTGMFVLLGAGFVALLGWGLWHLNKAVVVLEGLSRSGAAAVLAFAANPGSPTAAAATWGAVVVNLSVLGYLVLVRHRFGFGSPPAAEPI